MAVASPDPGASALARDFLARLGDELGDELGAGGGGRAGLGSRGGESEDDDDDDDDDDGGGGGGGERSMGVEAGSAHALLSKRAAKKLRKKQAEEAEAVAEQPIDSGFGHRMLLQMGWGGQGVGLRDDGIAEPVKADSRGKRGLAAEDEALLRETEQSIAASSSTTAGSVGGQAGGGARKKRRADGRSAEEGPKSATWRVELGWKEETDQATVWGLLSNKLSGHGVAVLNAMPLDEF